MRRLTIPAACLLVMLGPGLGRAQEVDRGKAEVIAAGQATEADRLFKAGDWSAALPLYEAERASRSALGDVRYEAYALRAIGLCQANLGDDEAAIEALGQAKRLDLKRDDKGYAGYDLFLMAQCYLRLDRAEEGLKSLMDSLPLLSQAIDRDHEADARLVLTRTLATLGRAEEARSHAARAIELAEALNDPWRLADAWASSGQVEGSLGNGSLAFERFADARELFEQQGRAAESAWMETVSGSTLLMLGRPDLALAQFQEAARLHEHLEDFGALSEDLAAVAGLQLENGQVQEAFQAARKAVDKAQEVDDRAREIEARVRLAQVQGHQNDWLAASNTLDEAVTLIRQVARDEPAEQIRLLLTAAAADQKAKLDDRAALRIESARKVADDSKLPALKEIVATAWSRFEDRERLPSPPKPPR